MEHLHNCIILRDDAEVVIDFCQECKTKLIYRKCRHSGRIDNNQYLKDHELDFLQRNNPLWEKYWGKKQNVENTK